MTNKNLVDALKKIEFSERYSRLYSKYSEVTAFETVTSDEVNQVLNGMQLDLPYSKKEKFFKLREDTADYTFQLNIAVPYGMVELIFFAELKKEKKKMGGPFGRLLKMVEPKVKRSLKIPFSNLEELRHILKEGLSIFEDLKFEIINGSS